MSVIRKTSFLWALLLLLLLPLCTAQEPYYYVKPTSDTSCPADPCLTLSEYVQQSNQYLTSDATMMFLPGVHKLDNDFIVTNVASFRLIGNTTLLPEVTPQVTCTRPVGFLFKSVLQLEISGLAITGCSSYNKSAIKTLLVQRFELNNCSLNNNIDARALHVTSSNVSIMHTEFVNNSVPDYGGGVDAIGSTVTIEGCSFINNSAGSYGGGVGGYVNTTIQLNGNNLFERNQAGTGGGAIQVYRSCTLHLNGDNLFINNQGHQAGAVFVFLSTVIVGRDDNFIGNSVFSNNRANTKGGAVSLTSSCIHFEESAKFVNNSVNEQGGAVHALSSEIDVLAGNVSFLYNSASDGGGLSLEYNSTLSFQPGAHVLFEGNTAEHGAAIHFNSLFQCLDFSGLDDRGQNIVKPYCFFRIPPLILPHIYITFVDNSAKELGSVLYGGLLDRCKVSGYEESELSPNEVFRSISTFASGNSTISSEPLQVCFCRNNTPDCAYEHPHLKQFRGQKFTISLAALDQITQSIPATIRAELSSSYGSNARIGDFENIKQIEGACTELHYTLFSPDDYEELLLYAEGSCSSKGTAARTIGIELVPCPDGFVRSHTECDCEPRLQTFTSTCNVSKNSIERSGTFWMDVHFENSTYKGLILYPHCPFDYCKAETADIPLNNTDAQCIHGRSGTLCGSCHSGLSIALGSSHCLHCSNAYLALILPFAVLGLLLVITILLLKLTVAIGTINGLIFYANIISANRNIFFPHDDTNVLTVFISWLNLDWGIETCFYDGMDTYAKTWLQFTFPFYIWALVVLIIIASHFSMKISKVLGSNPVAVLATLFLLSYANILSTVVAALSYASLEYPDNITTPVWLYDGNISYFDPKHIPLVLFALLILLFLFLPYTLLLFFHQWLQMKSGDKILKWVTKPQVKAFMDAYHAPYTPNHRYWTGLLLILRCALYLVFAFNTLGDPSVNLLVIATSTFGITIIVWLTGRVYENWWVDALESSFILNLGVLAVGTYHIKQTGGNQAALVYTLVSIAFTTFIGITLYHTYFQLKSTVTGKRLLKSMILPFHRVWTMLTHSNSGEQMQENDVDKKLDDSFVTSSYIDLRELLLDDK